MSYIGNKNIDGIKQGILSLIPRFSTFIEAFAGSATIAKNVYTQDKNILLIEKDKTQACVLMQNLPAIERAILLDALKKENLL